MTVEMCDRHQAISLSHSLKFWYWWTLLAIGKSPVVYSSLGELLKEQNVFQSVFDVF